MAIPTFGRNSFLAECLDSIAFQSYRVEPVVCDGGSCFNFSDPKWCWIKYRSLVPDPGIVACWSEAANICQGEYLAFLADDNILESQYAESMLEFMNAHPTCEVVFCNQYVMDQTGQIDLEASHRMTERYGRHHLQNGILNDTDIYNLIKWNSIPLEACVIRRSVWEKYGPFSPQAFGAFDLHFFTSLLLKGVRFGFLPRYLMRFRVHSESYTVRQREQHLRGTIWALENAQTNDSAIRKILTKRLLSCYGQLLKLDVLPEERSLLSKKLSGSMDGLQVLAKTIVSCQLQKVKRQLSRRITIDE
ncbi:glycosyltransferase [Leptolyngbya sp. FACHB-261]|nr:glycosyltransferase [Leptolyngbya sp. FACHB-261]